MSISLRRISVENFMSHAETTLDLEETGITAIVGPNGAGKSSIPEAVAYAFWGKTLRGTAPWQEDTTCRSAVLIGDWLTVTRSRTKGKTKLTWADDHPQNPGNTEPEYETPTKAQEALERIVGTFDVWRRSSVFSSQDAMHFSLATDAERKRLIEAILGLDRFDPALEACREDLKAATERAAALRASVASAAQSYQAECKRLAEAKQGLAMAPPADVVDPKPGKTLKELDASLHAASRELAAAREQLRAADRAGAEFDTLARGMLALLDRLQKDRCPTCAQPITTELRARLRKEATETKEKGDSARAAASVTRGEIESLVAELAEEVDAFNAKRAARATELRMVTAAQEEQQRYKVQRQYLTAVLQEAEQAIDAHAAVVEQSTASLVSADASVAELSACEKVLGLRGVRAHILGRSLSGIEAVSNSWLARLGYPGLQMALKPYSEKKTGGLSDSISLDVHGAGNGLGYKATSGGERRRLDIALLLAIAEVAGAASGHGQGTLFFDEVFDALDDEGAEACAMALFELAKTRAVVVITHSQTLLDRLPGARRVRIAQGTLDALT